jgi:hypothetical protein
MESKLYVGGLPYAATETQLTTLFATHGTVESARVIADKFTGPSRGHWLCGDVHCRRGAGSHYGLKWHANGRPIFDRERATPMEPRAVGGGRSNGGGHGRNRY